ncbi:MAG: type II toxin-antitoxin system VapC family toxin [Methanophagales archaeon ANME-1-THS]|nr:MAG: type II toxin-antitoxin system VapC family toxin [Methanophagales archaeon ANME-1-THS]
MVVFDTESLLIFYLGEKGADIVEDLLRRIQRKEEKGFLNIVNLTEFYYILYRRAPALADEKVHNLRVYGLQIVPLADNAVWREAGKIKGEHAISLADAFAAATARVKKDKLVVGRDEDFNKIGVPLIRAGLI